VRAGTSAGATADGGCCTDHMCGASRARRQSTMPTTNLLARFVGSDGQDDATTDDDGHFDISATGVRDQLVVFYGDSNVTRKLDAKLCDEVIDLRIAATRPAPLTM
jgi:hypothetical protein